MKITPFVTYIYTCLSCSHLLIRLGHNLYQTRNMVSLFKLVTLVYIFSVLSCNSPGEPFATSSPKSTHSHTSLCHHNSTTHHGYHTNRKCKTVNRPLKIISLNFQSIKNKKPELDLLLDTTKPDIIIGTETWLDPSITSSEYFPANRWDRPPNSKGQSHGGGGGGCLLL